MGSAVAYWLLAQGAGADSVLGQGPTRGDLHRKEGERLTVLVGQE